MKKVLSIITVLLCIFTQISTAQVTLDYYLNSSEYNESIPKPKDIIGHEIGEWHISHEHLVQYMYALAASSNRVQIQEYGRTYENRPLLSLFISSPENLARLEEIRQAHVSLSDPSKSSSLNTADMPAVIYMGFSVHGNEPSGANASNLVAYRLAASNEKEIIDALDNTIIIFDPSFNPDGLSRFAHWANTNKGKNLVADPQHREHNEYWPAGRTNHYWFDLNRDWLPVQHVEMEGRIKLFHQWKPNVLTDHHEMGTNATFFFQPGIPSRTNPITPQKNQELTGVLAEFHAKAFDDRNALYYSKESFDDFYYGKGSTYPDVNGAIGILFEQARARGHVQESINGLLTFPFTIKNQFEAAFSTLKGLNANRVTFLNYQRDFYKNALNEAKKNPIKAYVFGDQYDSYTTNQLAKLLLRHQIKVEKLTSDISIDNQVYKANAGYVVKTNQPQYRLIRAFFEKTTQFNDSLFYDVSAWTMPLAFNLPYAEVKSKKMKSVKSNAISEVTFEEGKLVQGRNVLAYAFSISPYLSYRAIYQIQKAGLRIKVATAPFDNKSNGERVAFNRGSVIVALGNQDVSDMQVESILKKVAKENGITIYGLETGLTEMGQDIGSSSNLIVNKPNVLLFSGDGTRSYDVGELWHLLDTRYDIPTTLFDVENVSRYDLSRYNVILMAGGSYYTMGESGKNALRDWVQNGGTLVAMTSAVRWLASNKMIDLSFKRGTSVTKTKKMSYADFSRLSGAQYIGGTIFETKLDLTHPLSYGLNSDRLPVFRNHTNFVELPENEFSSPFRYTSSPLLSGYSSAQNLEAIKNTAAVTTHRSGSGRIIGIQDNPNFRAFWYGPNKVLMNAIFFGNTISSRTTGR